jgi:uncharacterized protein (DUF3084 family)
MAAAKKPTRRRKIQASDVTAGTRTLEAVLTDLAEVVKECAVRSAHAEQVAAEAARRSAQAEQVAAEAARRSAQAEQVAAEAARRSALAEERSARAEEGSHLALKTIGALLQDLHALAVGTNRRLMELEKASAG